jgi:acetyl/propionyl-CoA carboxylase alpha subunit
LPIRKLLIANRGEIAVRVARTCREMGIASVAVCSTSDRRAPHTRASGETVHIGESYLDIERIVGAARRSGADALHPGYGFLAENADLAEACARAGLVFVGPSPEAMSAMGLKTAAREIARHAGVPVIPSYRLDQEIDYPVLIKASAGGGGRGMRIVHHPDDLLEAMESGRREAENAFGDGSLLLEKYIERARHIEFQIFGDQHGNVMHLFERECSVQRRYQKTIEESPSPALDDDLRSRMGEAAVAIARAIHYTSAGTVEFLLAPSGDFYFIEVNARIQVEHPVTELVTGLDLIRLQIEVAEGGCLPAQPRCCGHAIEARLNAEDPLHDFAPSAGVIQVWRPPGNCRVDTAIEEGTEIGIHYDSLLAKIISYGDDRESARRKLVHALESTRIQGVRTNREYLIQLLDSSEFREGAAHTAWLPPAQPAHLDKFIFVAAAILFIERTAKRILPGVPPNYRNNPYRDPSVKLKVDGEERTVTWKNVAKDRYFFDSRTLIDVLSSGADRITLLTDGLETSYELKQAGDEIFVWSAMGECTIQRLPRHPRGSAAGGYATANSPMPGKVLRILVAAGQHVSLGDPLVVLEAMKMEQTIRTTINGVVSAILVEPGQVIAPAQMLVEISALEKAQ